MSTYSGSYFKDEMLGHPNNLDVDHLEQTGSNSTGNLKHKLLLLRILYNIFSMGFISLPQNPKYPNTLSQLIMESEIKKNWHIPKFCNIHYYTAPVPIPHRVGHEIDLPGTWYPPTGGPCNREDLWAGEGTQNCLLPSYLIQIESIQYSIHTKCIGFECN